MRLNTLLALLLAPLGCLPASADTGISGFDSKNFAKYWKVESESPDFRTSFSGDTLEIVAPKGLTLWRKEKMKGNVTVEYDACVMEENPGDRLSDLNCFWMASDPNASDIWKNLNKRGGKFVNSYALQLYYLGYGGNSNSTTRFRRYDGNADGIENAGARPRILREYTDAANLLQPNKWYHIKIVTSDRGTEYYIDGKRLVDYRDPNPLREGWFGFRTTESRTKITNFKWSEQNEESAEIPVKWINGTPGTDRPVTLGIPFRQGEVKNGSTMNVTASDGNPVATDSWNLATWPDGSVKWMAVAGVMPAGDNDLTFTVNKDSKKKNATPTKGLTVTSSKGSTIIDTGKIKAFIPQSGELLIDSLVFGGTTVATNGRLIASTQSEPVLESTRSISFSNYASKVTSVEQERVGDNRAVIKINGTHIGEDGREWLPFTVRLYFYANSPEIKMLHTFIYDGDQNTDFIKSMGVRFDVPMREQLYNRHVAFSVANGGVWSEPVKPLVGRRVLSLDPDAKGRGGDNSLQVAQMRGERIPDPSEFNEYNQKLIEEWAAWDSYRLSQLTADGYEIRKRAHDNNPWIGTFSGSYSTGYAFVGDVSGGLGIRIKDFRESYPSSIEINGATTPAATVTAWLWSPEASPMDMRHYDNVAHGLNSSYEDVQEGMSTPYGIARTSELTLLPLGGYAGKADFALTANTLAKDNMLLPTPEYLHSRKAFGVWSLPDTSNSSRKAIEDKLALYLDFYKNAIEQNRWYGFWNYGDVMHAYDPVRHEWRYDVGGYAWDNTELGSPMWLWYSFLRTGDPTVWKMAEAMTRHNGEVDVYHIGDNKYLGTRHNVSHWGCGAKEGRISQAAWNRFYHYLTADERTGDLMTEVKDADHLLYTLDPMRLAEPRDMYPCTAPARLRIGPDWLSYVGNWMTEWERTGNTFYRDKIITGMKCIAGLPNRMFTGPLALGYDPATGVITTECDPELQTTNHLMTIMAGFEVNNELQMMIDMPEWNDAWLDHAARYKEMSAKILHNKFRVSRLHGYAAYKLNDPEMAKETWTDLLTKLESTDAPKTTVATILPPEVPAPKMELLPISTNDAALWSLDAIYLQEVIPIEEDELAK